MMKIDTQNKPSLNEDSPIPTSAYPAIIAYTTDLAGEWWVKTLWWYTTYTNNYPYSILYAEKQWVAIGVGYGLTDSGNGHVLNMAVSDNIPDLPLVEIAKTYTYIKAK